jgi:hypothetical protein
MSVDDIVTIVYNVMFAIMILLVFCAMMGFFDKK